MSGIGEREKVLAVWPDLNVYRNRITKRWMWWRDCEPDKVSGHFLTEGEAWADAASRLPVAEPAKGVQPQSELCKCGHPRSDHVNFGVAECDACHSCGQFDPPQPEPAKGVQPAVCSDCGCPVGRHSTWPDGTTTVWAEDGREFVCESVNPPQPEMPQPLVSDEKEQSLELLRSFVNSLETGKRNTLRVDHEELAVLCEETKKFLARREPSIAICGEPK